MELIKKQIKIFIICGKARSGKSTVAGIIRNSYEKKNLKVLNLMYSEYLKNYAKKITGWDGNERTKPRTFLQELGTDYIRKNIDENFFVKRLVEDLEIYSNFFDIITISDARFLNEIEVPKNYYKCFTIKVETDKISEELTEIEKRHISENYIDLITNYDFVIKNNGTILDLKNNVLKIVEEVEK